MKLKLLIALCTLTFSAASGADTVTANYQDWWWNPAQSGMGINTGQQDNTPVVAWYLFDANEQGMYLMLSGELEDGSRLPGTLYRTTGPVPGSNYSPSQVKSIPVGSATLEFNSVREGVLTYDYEGNSGSLAAVHIY